MPKDYSKGKIYYVKSNMTDKVYIGSTTQPLSKRMGEHKSKYKRFIEKGVITCKSIEICKYPDAYIELIEYYPCSNIEELNRREGEVQREHDNRVNINIAGRTKAKYNIDNKEKIAEQKKAYREEHKDELKEYNKKYQEEHKDELKEKHAEYYVENREYFREIQKEYNAEHSKENVERVKQYRIDNPDCRKKKTTCECGAEVLAEGLRAHLMTDIHAERMKPDYVEPEPYDEKKYRAEQYQKNKEKLKDKNTRLIRCECMLYLTVNNKGTHLKGDIHSKQMALLELGESNTTHTLCECGVFVLITNSGMKNHLKTKKHKQIMEKLATDFMA